MVRLPKLVWRKNERQSFFAEIVLLNQLYSFSETLRPEIVRQFFASIAKKEPIVPRKELTPTAVRSIRIGAQAQKKRGINIFITVLNTEDDCNAVCDIAKEIAVTLMDTPFEIRRVGKYNKHVVWASPLVPLDVPCPLL